MAGNITQSGPILTEADLAGVVQLTQELARAVAQGDLDRALELLEKRRRTLKEFSWPNEAEPDFWEKVQALRALEAEMLTFCRTWRGVVEKRLKALNVGHFLRMTYCPPVEESRFVDVSK
jgi:hypothetical protein